MLVIRDLSFGYRRRHDQLKNINLTLDTGRTVLLGPNGSGKSTLLRVLAGTHRPRGSICLDGTEVHSARRSREYRTAVGWLPQEVRPFPGLSAREHLAYTGWLKGMTRAAAWEAAPAALATVGLASEATTRADRLSGGQVRRLGIASVLVHRARYLLLDEPTAGLDPRERDRFIEALEIVERTHAVLVATHDTESLADPGAKVVVLTSGEIRFDGTFRAFTKGSGGGVTAATVKRAYAAYAPENA